MQKEGIKYTELRDWRLSVTIDGKLINLGYSANYTPEGALNMAERAAWRARLSGVYYLRVDDVTHESVYGVAAKRKPSGFFGVRKGAYKTKRNR